MREEIFVKVVIAVFTIAWALITAYVIPWIKAKIGSDEIEKLSWFATCAIRAAEQMFTPEQWAEKKAYVVCQLKIIMNDQLSLKLTDDQLNVIIEGIVNEVKHGGA